MSEVTFPPLMPGPAATGAEDLFRTACMKAALGCDAGLVVHDLGTNSLSAALVFASEVPPEEAMAKLPACGVGVQNALGALAPPEVAVHLQWAGGVRINGAKCGRFRVAARTGDPEAVPDWLVVGFGVPLWPTRDDPWETPDETALYAEGCADVQAPELLESWARHTLNWISRREAEGVRPLHDTWCELAQGMGEEVAQGDLTGKFLGIDERFGMLLRDGETTRLTPATRLLEELQMKLARAKHFDERDTRVFAVAARTGEGCIPGGFEFSTWSEADLVGKARQVFANGWFELETSGRVTFVAVTWIEPAEVGALTDMLAEHFVAYCGAPDTATARAVVGEEINLMLEHCDVQADNTLLTVARELTPAGVREAYRVIEPQEAELDIFAVHGCFDEQGATAGYPPTSGAGSGTPGQHPRPAPPASTPGQHPRDVAFPSARR